VGGSSERPALIDQSPEAVRPRTGLARRLGVVAVLLALFALAGCSGEVAGELARLGLPEPATNEGPTIASLWVGTWIAAGVIGVGTWALIFYAAVRFKTKHNETPKQNRYNLPMEIFYTIAPFIVVGVLFYYTILAQNTVTRNDTAGDVTVNVVAQKWSWSFNYKSADNPAVGTDVYEVGTINKTPTLYLPVNKSVRFVLTSYDVIHSFWVPSFYRKLDVIPGKDNTMVMTPTQEGTFRGKCTELCGTYHSAMLFNVAVVSEEEYNAYLKSLADRGQVGEVRGAGDAYEPAPREDQTGPQKDEDRAGESRGNE
jgi:cytochrome c oxidase subunit 2